MIEVVSSEDLVGQSRRTCESVSRPVLAALILPTGRSLLEGA